MEKNLYQLLHSFALKACDTRIIWAIFDLICIIYQLYEMKLNLMKQYLSENISGLIRKNCGRLTCRVHDLFF